MTQNFSHLIASLRLFLESLSICYEFFLIHDTPFNSAHSVSLNFDTKEDKMFRDSGTNDLLQLVHMPRTHNLRYSKNPYIRTKKN